MIYVRVQIHIALDTCWCRVLATSKR